MSDTDKVLKFLWQILGLVLVGAVVFFGVFLLLVVVFGD